MKDTDSRSYRVLASISLAVGLIISLIGTYLLTTVDSTSPQSTEDTGAILLKLGIILVLAGLLLAGTAAFKRRRALSRGLKVAVASLLLLSAPIVVGLIYLVFQL